MNRLNYLLRVVSAFRNRTTSWRRFEAILQKQYNLMKMAADMMLLVLSPILVFVAWSLIISLSYATFTVSIPLISGGSLFTTQGFLHSIIIAFFDFNIGFNYILCVCTRNSGVKRERVVYELAEATGFDYPETNEEIDKMKHSYERKIIERRNINRSLNEINVSSSSQFSSNGISSFLKSRVRRNVISETPQIGWMLLGPQEWGFCFNSNKPKPPRSHYDHVTKNLVLNMDHYCPWMFNAVGYFNYRYFVNFLFYVVTATSYAALIALRPYRNLDSPSYIENIRLSRETLGRAQIGHMVPFVPTPDERSMVAFAFMMCSSVAIAVSTLLFLHIYLLLTAQTTIEFQANVMKARAARHRGTRWLNPYNLGMKRNFQQIYGTSNPLVALLPSTREPEFLPLPIPGDKGRRLHKRRDSEDCESLTRLNIANANIPWVV